MPPPPHEIFPREIAPVPSFPPPCRGLENEGEVWTRGETVVVCGAGEVGHTKGDGGAIPCL